MHMHKNNKTHCCHAQNYAVPNVFKKPGGNSRVHNQVVASCMSMHMLFSHYLHLDS